MPVEIKELVVRAVAVERGEAAPTGGRDRASRGAAEEGRDALVEACVKQVLRILRRSGER